MWEVCAKQNANTSFFVSYTGHLLFIPGKLSLTHLNMYQIYGNIYIIHKVSIYVCTILNINIASTFNTILLSTLTGSFSFSNYSVMSWNCHFFNIINKMYSNVPTGYILPGVGSFVSKGVLVQILSSQRSLFLSLCYIWSDAVCIK